MYFKNVFRKKSTQMLYILGLSSLVACSPSHQGSPNLDTGSDAITRGHALKANSNLSHFIVAVVAEQAGGEALCTGSILSENSILTAAHCVDGEPTKIQIVFANNIKKAQAASTRLATAIYQNPSWHNSSADEKGDLAVIKFSGGLPKGFLPVKLASDDFELSNDQDVLFAGYGVTNGTKDIGAGLLRMTKTKVIGQQSKTEVITNGRDTSVCFGDSGGPGFVFINNEFIQWGVASSVLNQACNKASIHTSIMDYKSWIQATMLR